MSESCRTCRYIAHVSRWRRLYVVASYVYAHVHVQVYVYVHVCVYATEQLAFLLQLRSMLFCCH